VLGVAAAARRCSASPSRAKFPVLHAAAARRCLAQNFMGLCTAPPCLVCEYCPRGSLYDTLRDARKYPARARELTWVVRLRMVSGKLRELQVFGP
jgi:hypothetical protein